MSDDYFLLPDPEGPGWVELYEHELVDGRIVYAGKCRHPYLWHYESGVVQCKTCQVHFLEDNAIVPTARTWIVPKPT